MESSIDSLVTVEESKEVIEPAIISIPSPELDDEKFQFPDCLSAKTSLDRASTSDRVPIPSPFKRWVNSLRPKRAYEQQPLVEDWHFISRGNDNKGTPSPCPGSLEQQWEKLSGRSSHLGTIKTATMSIASQSVIRSRRTTQSSINRSKSDFRNSMELSLSTSIDQEAQNRACKRRQVLQEIITTESDYIFDLKALANLLLIISARPEIYHNVQRIRESHESFLRQIRILVPTSNLSRAQVERMMNNTEQKRPHAVDLSIKAFQSRSLRIQNQKTSTSRRLKELASEANEALLVAREIRNLSYSFINYKEFCENYDLLHEDTALLRRSVRNWQGFEQGIEALTKSAASMETRSLYDNKSLCLNDILIKELLRWTHIQDDPSAHDEIGEVLESVREVLAEINEATTNTMNRDLVEKTFLLQDMLDLKSASLLPLVTFNDIYKQLGPMTLCGVLFVTYRASTQPRQVKGAFMVCVLFKHHFFIAKMNDDYRRLRPLACLYISDVRIDGLTNGKGYDYFCEFSWKLLFQLEDEKFELVLSASSAAEEKQWKTGILKSAAASVDAPNAVSSELRGSSFLILDLVPEEEVSDIAPQLSRRPSLQTLGTTQRVRSDLQPIIIRKTYCPHKHGQTQQVGGELDRPKVPPPVPQPFTITARRQDRIRLERTIFPIYTRDALPYPGMFLAPGELFFGPGSIMRHLSLRSKRFQRSSSINLPTPLQNVTEVQGVDETEDKMQAFKKRKRRDATDFSHSLEHEKSWMLHKDSALIIGRSKTLKVRTSPRPSCNSSSQPAAKAFKADRGSDNSEASLRKGLWSIFNSLSLRRSKKNARPRLSGV
ncbi:putative Rho guanyl nucleotide exchange factor [Aspergillus undulatus]|uniref:putative Rho guanyl nucleotide exchange factor n=1 Tax=Aspergillus undulatus TaxID=1810928 RepID=UPI003CCE33B6